jgi:hypothetical protein
MPKGLFMTDKCNRGLDDRCRDGNGEIRRKNGATRVGTLRQTYGEDFAPGVRSDMKLDTLLAREGEASLSRLIRKR